MEVEKAIDARLAPSERILRPHEKLRIIAPTELALGFAQVPPDLDHIAHDVLGERTDRINLRGPKGFAVGRRLPTKCQPPKNQRSAQQQGPPRVKRLRLNLSGKPRWPRSRPPHLHPDSRSSLLLASSLLVCRDRPRRPDPEFLGRASNPIVPYGQIPGRRLGVVPRHRHTDPRRAKTSLSVLPKSFGHRMSESAKSTRPGDAGLIARNAGCDEIIHSRIRCGARLKIRRGVSSVEVVVDI
jgi:hypothetical protein